MSNIKFTIEATMDERWINPFLSMLDRMERNGRVGHSEIVGLYSDGDGDFHPTFNFKIDKNNCVYTYPLPSMAVNNLMIYDADYDVIDKEIFIEHYNTIKQMNAQYKEDLKRLNLKEEEN